jgi:hypothetical protein
MPLNSPNEIIRRLCCLFFGLTSNIPKQSNYVSSVPADTTKTIHHGALLAFLPILQRVSVRSHWLNHSSEAAKSIASVCRSYKLSLYGTGPLGFCEYTTTPNNAAIPRISGICGISHGRVTNTRMLLLLPRCPLLLIQSWVFRYDAVDSSAQMMGSSPHSDWGTLTVVWQYTKGGLQTYCHSCASWSDVDASSSSSSMAYYFVHVGDFLVLQQYRMMVIKACPCGLLLVTVSIALPSKRRAEMMSMAINVVDRWCTLRILHREFL